MVRKDVIRQYFLDFCYEFLTERRGRFSTQGLLEAYRDRFARPGNQRGGQWMHAHQCLVWLRVDKRFDRDRKGYWGAVSDESE